MQYWRQFLTSSHGLKSSLHTLVIVDVAVVTVAICIMNVNFVYVCAYVCTCRRLEMDTCVLSETAGPLTFPLLLLPIQPVENPKSS